MAGGLVPQLPQSVRRMSRNFSNAISVVIDTPLMASYLSLCVCVSACVYAREREHYVYVYAYVHAYGYQ